MPPTCATFSTATQPNKRRHLPPRQPDIDLRSSGQRPAGGARGGITPAELLFTIPIFSLKEERSMQRDMMPMAIPSGPEDVFPWFLARIIPFRTQE